MSCNGCRILRKGCSEACILRPCLQWIESPEAQGHATVFVAKFFGRAGLMSFISAVPETQRPALFQSLLFEACGRTINPVNGAVGLLWSGNWHLCCAAVETVLRGGTLLPLSDLDDAAADHGSASAEGGLYARPRAAGWSIAAKQRKTAPANDMQAPPCDLELCLTPRSLAAAREERRLRPETPSMTSEGSVTTSGESGGDRLPRLLNLFV
ncbi:LOB domain-containing protein 38 [Elaeis guineensis]|uniref:LOB domain-containing protein 38 n=1 Tax=Elaeis guineensis var. tenera TaxID=51953 RepID=A0A6I9SGE6_ELAGV|nr:LOB domain-containing protein 38 [Elaeis guineensis]